MTTRPSPSTPVLLLPGWQDSGPTHWQSHWAHLHGYRKVEQNDWQWPRRGDWMARLDEVVTSLDAPAVLVAHSLGCQLVAAWAAHSQHAHRVTAALLVAPPDTEREDMPPQLFNWRPIVRQVLPFASLLVTSSDDPYGAADRVAQMAADWLGQHQNDPGLDYRATADLVQYMAQDDPAGVAKWTSQFPVFSTNGTDANHEHPALIAVSQWLQSDPGAAKTWLQQQPSTAPWVVRFLPQSEETDARN